MPVQLASPDAADNDTAGRRCCASTCRVCCRTPSRRWTPAALRKRRPLPVSGCSIRQGKAHTAGRCRKSEGRGLSASRLVGCRLLNCAVLDPRRSRAQSFGSVDPRRLQRGIQRSEAMSFARARVLLLGRKFDDYMCLLSAGPPSGSPKRHFLRSVACLEPGSPLSRHAHLLA